MKYAVNISDKESRDNILPQAYGYMNCPYEIWGKAYLNSVHVQ
ncbi:hypothetical protein [Nodularia spumigena]|nr:hypothetical protein [Nodularia spumigena]